MFNGGDGAAEILPYIDYENIRRNPKRIGSYSDGTAILNAVSSQTGLVTYYGTAPGVFVDVRHYDYMQFRAHFVDGFSAKRFDPSGKRKTLSGGKCGGTLIGGYTTLFALMLSNKYLSVKNQDYILFLESHEKYGNVGMTAEELAFIEQTQFMANVKGLIFGHYSVDVPHDLLHCLERFGARHNIPVIYTDDFGHGTCHGILPIGITATLDAENKLIELHDCH